MSIAKEVKPSYDEFLAIFKNGYMVDETSFCFYSDPNDYYIGYLPEYDKHYWAGYCDIEGGCEFKTADELFNAPIYNGKSIKERWGEITIINIGGIFIDDWFKFVNNN